MDRHAGGFVVEVVRERQFEKEMGAMSIVHQPLSLHYGFLGHKVYPMRCNDEERA